MMEDIQTVNKYIKLKESLNKLKLNVLTNEMYFVVNEGSDDIDHDPIMHYETLAELQAFYDGVASMWKVRE